MWGLSDEERTNIGHRFAQHRMGHPELTDDDAEKHIIQATLHHIVKKLEEITYGFQGKGETTMTYRTIWEEGEWEALKREAGL